MTVAVAIYYLPDINSGWLLASKSYGTLGVDYFGGFARLAVYGTSTLMAASVLAWVPERRVSITYLGERTLYVYLLHGFFIQYFREMELFFVKDIFGLIVIAFVSAMIVYLLSSRVVITIAQPLIEISTSRLQQLLQHFRRLLNV